MFVNLLIVLIPVSRLRWTVANKSGKTPNINNKTKFKLRHKCKLGYAILLYPPPNPHPLLHTVLEASVSASAAYGNDEVFGSGGSH